MERPFLVEFGSGTCEETQKQEIRAIAERVWGGVEDRLAGRFRLLGTEYTEAQVGAEIRRRLHRTVHVDCGADTSIWDMGEYPGFPANTISFSRGFFENPLFDLVGKRRIQESVFVHEMVHLVEAEHFGVTTREIYVHTPKSGDRNGEPVYRRLGGEADEYDATYLQIRYLGFDECWAETLATVYLLKRLDDLGIERWTRAERFAVAAYLLLMDCYGWFWRNALLAALALAFSPELGVAAAAALFGMGFALAVLAVVVDYEVR